LMTRLQNLQDQPLQHDANAARDHGLGWHAKAMLFNKGTSPPRQCQVEMFIDTGIIGFDLVLPYQTVFDLGLKPTDQIQEAKDYTTEMDWHWFEPIFVRVPLYDPKNPKKIVEYKEAFLNVVSQKDELVPLPEFPADAPVIKLNPIIREDGKQHSPVIVGKAGLVKLGLIFDFKRHALYPIVMKDKG